MKKMRAHLSFASAASFAALCLSVTPAGAQVAHVDDNDWRQTDRHDALLAASKQQKFEVELRFAPYLPNIDSEFAGTGKAPFNQVFGFDCANPGTPKPNSVSPRLYFGAEFDYLPLRVPYVGVVGPGVSWGYTSFSNNAVFSPGTPQAGTCSGETTTLTIMPMYAAVVLRADELYRRTGIPLVPYGKFGVGLAYWRASTDKGTDYYCQRNSTGDCVGTQIGGDGVTPSLHLAVGLSLSLNFINPSASARLGVTTGVQHAYFFGEIATDKRTLAVDVLEVGALTWVLGLAADM